MKKTLSLIMAALFVMSCLNVVVFAAETHAVAKIESKAEMIIGEEFDVYVSLENYADIRSLALVIGYDSKVIEQTTNTAEALTVTSDVLMSDYDGESAVYASTGTLEAGITAAGGKVLKVSFKAIAAGNANITCEVTEEQVSGEKVTYSAEGCAVVVKSEPHAEVADIEEPAVLDEEIVEDVEIVEDMEGIDAIVEETWENPFIDVFESDSYYEAVEYVYENGLFKGVSAIEFAPDTTMTRAMFVTVLGRLHGITEDYVGESVFEDVVEGEWYAPYVVWAADNGIVLGYGDGMFGINDKITIEQAAVILARYAAFIALETASEYNLAENYADAANVAAWAAEAMAWAVEEGIYAGADGYLYPQTPASRALIATMLYGFAY